MSQPHKLCMIPVSPPFSTSPPCALSVGPIEFHEDVLDAMSTPATSHVDPLFVPIFGESIELLRKVLLTKDAQPFIVAGSGTLGWDMMVNLVERDDEVLVLNTGYFGDKFGECLEVYGAKVTHLRAPIGDRPSLDELKKALSAKKYKMVTVTHVDTSTGVLSDVKGVAETVKSISPETLVVVDGVCSVGSEEIRFDEWKLDAVITASQKALGVPPRSLYRCRQPTSFASLQDSQDPFMTAYEARKPAYFATPAVQLIYALLASLKQLTAQSMDTRFDQHRQVSQKFKKAITDLGLKQLAVSDEVAANGMTAIWLPEGVQVSDIVPSLAAKGVQIAGGLHTECATKYFRIGHMGISVTEPQRGHIDKVIESLTTTLKEVKSKA
ncbi:hypothetical protein NQZ79_g2140 [Umbelopsis isabellina]|nr:hypothetical protein NQZ79_g2140 [Umbelopsis isabellina]